MEQQEKVKFLTIAEAADSAEGLTRYAIRKMIEEGTLPCLRSGKKILIAEQALLEVIRRTTVLNLPDNAIAEDKTEENTEPTDTEEKKVTNCGLPL